MNVDSRRPRARLETLSDLVFALALSVGSLSLIAKLPRTPHAIVLDVIQFGFSFLILITVWVGYTRTMSVLPLENRSTVALNILMLFLVAIEPFLFYLTSVYDLAQEEVLLDTASIMYALDLAGLMGIQASFTHQLTIEEKGLIPQSLMGTYRRIRNKQILAAALFAMTALPIFWTLRFDSTPLRFYLWFIPLITTFIRRDSSKT